MIKCKTKNGKTRMTASGLPWDLAADTMVIIETVRDALRKSTGDANAANYLRSIADMLTDPDFPFRVETPLAEEMDRLKKQEAAMTAHIRKYTDPDDLCKLCRHFAQCQEEGDNEDDKTTRFWRCKHGEEFQYKEEE